MSDLENGDGKKQSGQKEDSSETEVQPVFDAPANPKMRLFLGVFVTLCIVAVGVSIAYAGNRSITEHQQILDTITSEDPPSIEYVAHALGAVTSLDGFLLKTMALMGSMVVALLGCAFIVINAQANYSLALKGGTPGEAAIKSSSPGLVVVTIASALAAAVVLVRHSTEVKTQPGLTAEQLTALMNKSGNPPAGKRQASQEQSRQQTGDSQVSPTNVRISPPSQGSKENDDEDDQ